MASLIKNIEYIKKHFDEHFDFIIKKIEESNISLSNKSTKHISEIIYPIVNYIDFVNNNSTVGLDGLSINDISNLYYNWCNMVKEKFPQSNYVETNLVILDYRKNNIGYYWVDLQNYYNWEMLFRLNNCARANSYQTILELREYTIDNYNYSRVALAMSKDGFVNQIRGNYDKKADIVYRDFIYDLFLNYKTIKGFKFLFSKEMDFTHMDLTKDQLTNLKNKRPEMFELH